MASLDMHVFVIVRAYAATTLATSLLATTLM